MRLDGKITHGMVMDVESVGADNISFVFGPVGAYIDPSLYYTKEEIDAMLANLGAQSDWDESDTDSKAYIKNKPVLADVATSGSYDDLEDQPTIPTVPTNVSAFNNDAGYLNNSFCPIIEDARTSDSTDITTSIAPFNILNNSQRIILKVNRAIASNSKLIITLSDSTTTAAIPMYCTTQNGTPTTSWQTGVRGGYIECVYEQGENRWVMVGQRDTNTTYGSITQANIDSGGTTTPSLISSKLLCDNFTKISTFNNFCPIIEDTRSSAVAAITGVATFGANGTIPDRQLVIIRLAYRTVSSSTLNLTLSDGTTTNAIPIYIASARIAEVQVANEYFRANDYMMLVYDNSRTMWRCISQLDTSASYGTMSQTQIDEGTFNQGRLVTPQLLHDNAYIVEESYSSGSLKANKFYDFGTVSSALTIPSLDATNDLVSNALNFYALRFIAGADNISITFPTGVIVDDEPTINTGDYVEIMINKYGTNYYASIKVWQAQS